MISQRAPICTRHQVSWSEILPREHLLQIYAKEEDLLDSLERFVCGGLRAGESIIVIATAAHREALSARMRAQGIDVEEAIASGQFLPRDAEEMLNLFMLTGWPNKLLFEATVGKLLDQARSGNRKVRAYGEMVAILWAKGLAGATVWLEHLWNEYMQKHSFSLFCAYPKAGFSADSSGGLERICCEHTNLIEV